MVTNLILSIYDQMPGQYLFFYETKKFVKCHEVLVEVYLIIKPILCISIEKKINNLHGMCNATFDFGVYMCGRERIIMELIR